MTKALKRISFFILSLIFILVGLIYFNLNNTHRSLNSAEISELRSVFNSSIDYSKVVINTANLPPTMAGIVFGNHIIFREEYYVKDFSKHYLRMARLVHEAGHVWANQTIGIQSSLVAASEHLFYGDQVYAHQALTGKQSLVSFRYEQQCRILGDYYTQRHLGFDTSVYQALIDNTFLID